MISLCLQPFGVFYTKLDHILQKGCLASNYLSVSSLTKYLKLKFDKDPYRKGLSDAAGPHFRKSQPPIFFIKG